MRLGILGGGQLAQMMTQAAISLGVETAVFAGKPDSPAARLTRYEVVGDWDNQKNIQAFCDMVDVVTLENEFVNASVLDTIASAGVPVNPNGDTLRRIQDKLVQKQTMAAAGLPVPHFVGVSTPDDVIQAGSDLGWPLVLKARRDGYDGYGNATLDRKEDVKPAWERLAANGRELLVEAWVPFERELAVMVLRGRDGEIRLYPVVETEQRDHICHVVRAPAPIHPKTANTARQLAAQAVTAVNGVGVFGVELFELADGRVLYNEMAPRPHNSGHYSIEACLTSQFENHIRAVLGWPLGETSLVAPAAVMVNVLGRSTGTSPADAARPALTVPGAHVHIYSKRDNRIGRKMGHVTALGGDLDSAEEVARTAAELVSL